MHNCCLAHYYYFSSTQWPVTFEYNEEVEHVVAISRAVDKSWKWDSMQSFILTTPKKRDKFEWKREKEYFPLFSFFITVVTIKKTDNLADAYCKHQQIKKEVFLSNNQNVIWILLSIVKVEVPWWSCTLGMD